MEEIEHERGAARATHLSPADLHCPDRAILVVLDLAEPNGSVPNVFSCEMRQWTRYKLNIHGRFCERTRRLTIHLLPRFEKVFRVFERDETIFGLNEV